MGRMGNRLILTGAAALSLLAASACTGSGGGEPPTLGKFTVVAGNGKQGTPETGETAWTQPLNDIKDLAVGPQGEVYVAANCTVYKITDNTLESLYDEDQQWTGPGVRDKGPHCPETVATDAESDVFIAQQESPGRIWELTSDNKHIIVAGAEGSFQPPAQTEGKLAAKERLGQPRSLAPTPDGSFLYVLYPFDVEAQIRRVDVGGAIRTVAGASSVQDPPRPIKAPVPSDRAHIGDMSKILLDPQGHLLVANGSQLLRLDGDSVEPAGIASSRTSGDGSADAAKVPYSIVNVATAQDNSVILTDFQRIDRVNSDGQVVKVADLPHACRTSAPDIPPFVGRGIAVHSRIIYLLAPRCHRVLRIPLS